MILPYIQILSPDKHNADCSCYKKTYLQKQYIVLQNDTFQIFAIGHFIIKRLHHVKDIFYSQTVSKYGEKNELWVVQSYTIMTTVHFSILGVISKSIAMKNCMYHNKLNNNSQCTVIYKELGKKELVNEKMYLLKNSLFQCGTLLYYCM